MDRRCTACGVPYIHAPRLGLCHPCYDERRGTTTYRQQRDEHEAYLAALPDVRADGLLHSDYYRAWLANQQPGQPIRAYRVARGLPVAAWFVIEVREEAVP